MDDKREELLNKIRGMLSKTTENGATEEEELSALAMARAWMDAHEVTDAELKITKEESAILRSEPPGGKDSHGIKSGMSTAVGAFTDCRVWQNHKSKGGGLTFCGLPSDARFATWLLDHLAQFVQAELVNHLMGNVATGMPRRRAISGFVIGISERISERLIELCKPAPEATDNSRALVVTKQQLIKTKMDELGIKLRACGGSSKQFDNSSLNAGRSAGDRASFGRPIRRNRHARRKRGRDAQSPKPISGEHHAARRCAGTAAIAV